MKHFRRFFPVPLAAALLLAGCQSPPAPGPAAALVDPACVVDDTAYNHIFARHCTPSSGANQFVPAYCTKSGMQTFCGMVQNAPNKVRSTQPDGRVRYDANLGVAVGTAGEKCGRLIITSAANGTVVTQFPEFVDAPPPCN